MGFKDLLKAKPVRIIKECFGIYSVEEASDPAVKDRMIQHKFIVNCFENLPQSVIQLYETFDQGLTFGPLRTFSVLLSIVSSQKNSAEMLPKILKQMEEKFKHSMATYVVVKYLMIISVWALVYILNAIPFFIFFHEDQTEWYDKNGFDLVDWDDSEQQSLRITLIVMSALILVYIMIPIIWPLCKKEKR